MANTFNAADQVPLDSEVASLREEVRIATERLSDLAAEKAAQVAVGADRMASSLDIFAYSRPYTLAGYAVAAGFVLGVMCARR